jgi:probable 2-oxoglutarate dehydrogenase E1 component DHKTD1
MPPYSMLMATIRKAGCRYFSLSPYSLRSTDVERAVDIAFQYRHHFRKDIIIDLLVYRRWGHNELDEPAFTQPLMYEKIRSRKSVPTLYEERLILDDVITPAEAQAVRDAERVRLDTELARADTYIPSAPMLQGRWKGIVWPADETAEYDPPTGAARTVLEKIGQASVTVPSGFVRPFLAKTIRSSVNR